MNFRSFPNGSHVCEVKIDPEPGTVELADHWVVNDVSTEINPLTLIREPEETR